MVLNPRPIRLASARDVNTHLDAWSAAQLTSPEAWAEVLAATRAWADYSARNQLLLASYGAAGSVAGIETWRLVPTVDGSGCVVRGGEHGLPVRVPITTTGAEPDPHLGRARPTTAAVKGWEWRSVFCLEQLARRPDPTQLASPVVPDDIAQTFPDAARQVAKRSLRGRIPKLDDPIEILAQAAGRQARSSTRGAPPAELAAQAAWVTADRLGQATGAMPEIDPTDRVPRERWESLLDVLDGSRRLTAALGKDLGVDLLASPLPRMEIDDDRVVPAGRRNRLPRASLAQLPVGRWVDVGPYSRDEWAARGETAVGKGAYFRINTTAYLVAIEHGDRSSWRLEDTRALLGSGRLTGAGEDTLEDAKTTAVATVRTRYPQLATDPTEPDRPAPVGTRTGWEPLPDRPGSHRLRLDHDITAYVIAVGDRWLPMLERVPGRLLETAGLPTDNEADAQAAATQAARAAVRDRTATSRAEFDDTIAELANSPTYTHAKLVDRVSARLAEPERAALAAEPTPADLVELLGAAGVTPATTIAVLHAEGIAPEIAAAVLPTAGVTPADTIRALHERWEVGRVEAAEWIGATATEMRAAGCAAPEILAARPADVLAALPADPHLWELSGGTLAMAGHSPHDIVGFLASHAPDADCYAAGVAVAIDDPTVGLGLTLRRGMPVEALVSTSERYGLTPADTATALADIGAPPATAVQVLVERCDGDPMLTTQVARSVLQLRTDVIIGALAEHAPGLADVVDLREVRALSRDRDALVAANRAPRPSQPAISRLGDADRLLAALPEPDGSAAGSDRQALLNALPDPDPVGRDQDLLAALPEPALDTPHQLTEIEP